MQESQKQNEISTWAIVEIMGHQQIAGFAQTVPFGGVVMLRVDAPDLPERIEKVEKTWNSDTQQYVSADRVAPAEAGFTQFIGLGSVYRITPCTEDTAKRAAERRRTMGYKLLNVTPLQPQMALPGGEEDFPFDDPVDDSGP